MEILFYLKVMYRHKTILCKVANDLMFMIAEAGAESSEYFNDLFDELSLHTLRTIMYPVRKDNIPEGAFLPDGRSKFTSTVFPQNSYPCYKTVFAHNWTAVKLQQDFDALF